jgi:hypothetical protein
MSQYVGYRVKVVMQKGTSLEGTIIYVDNLLMKLRNGFFLFFWKSLTFTVQSNDASRGVIKELFVKADDITELEVLAKISKEYDELGASLELLRESTENLLTPTSFVRIKSFIPLPFSMMNLRLL